MKKIILTLAPVLLLLASCKTSDIKEPEYRDIRDVRIIDVGLFKTTAGLNLVYYNPNNFSLQLNDAAGDVYIDDIHMGSFDLNDKVQVRKQTEFVVPAVIKLNNISAITNHKDIWNKKEAKIRIEGIARVKKGAFTKEVPIKYEGIQNIEKLKSIISK